MSDTALSFVESRSGNVCVVSLGGRIDTTNAEELIARLKNHIRSGEKSILVDLGAVLYLTSSAFRALLVGTDEAARHQAKLLLCNISGRVRELFEIGGLLDSFKIVTSRDEGLAQLG
jgi:anti-anti-sigma factor